MPPSPAPEPTPVNEAVPDVAPTPAPVLALAKASAPVRSPIGYIVGGAVVPPALLADLAARGAKVRTVASATDLGGVPRYRPSAAIDEFVRMRAMTCMFPGCDQPATACDLDHTIRWPAGPTHPGNLGPKCRKHHLLKTFYGGPDGWQDRQLADGTIVWTAPTGHTYTSVPESRILFPDKITDTPLPNPPPEVADLETSPAPGRGIMMPTRRRTRAQNLAQQIAHERALNETDLHAAAATQEAAARRRAEREAAREAASEAEEHQESTAQHTPTDSDRRRT